PKKKDSRMYLGLEIQQFESLNGYLGNRIDLYEAQAKGRVGNLAQYIIGTYAGLQILDAEALTNQIFPEAKYEVF
ncbi:hypothetical protein RA267_30160, partial [Pseudomonas syringae pv. tagetis]|uniref:hypothetical protein n=1 Tax=Pseudomonas syringae group genomosp. 7 TaxID=251699 RepID=UPI00376FC2ED